MTLTVRECLRAGAVVAICQFVSMTRKCIVKLTDCSNCAGAKMEVEVLFEIDLLLGIQTYFCFPCTDSDCCSLNKCLACCLPIKPCQLFAYGQKMQPSQSVPVAIGKIWCCSLCYTMQQYYEATDGSPKDFTALATTMGKAGQAEMA